MAEVSHHRVQAGELGMHVAQTGERDAPPVLLLHGFPELWFSWRHQLPALADAGFRAIAPDMRGYGDTDRPEAVEAYDAVTLAGDVAALLDALGLERAVVVGHDWGAEIAWRTAILHPERVAAVAGMSVPFVPRPPVAPLPVMRRRFGEDFYIVWFQEPGEADAALAADPRRTLATREVWGPAWAQRDDQPPTPPWMTDDELAVYVETFSRTGFTGGINWYRNLDRTWERTAHVAERRVEQPALFVVGERDPVQLFMPPSAMDGWVTDLRESVVVPGAGHWIQQERPEEVNSALLRFLADVA